MVHVPLDMSSKSWPMLGSLETISCASLNHCWLLHAGWRQVLQASVTGRAQPTQLILLLASSSLLQGCFGAASWKIPTDRACEFSSWFQSASHSGFLWDAPLQNTFLSPAWQAEWVLPSGLCRDASSLLGSSASWYWVVRFRTFMDATLSCTFCFSCPSCCGHFWAALCSQQILNSPFWFNFLAFLSSPLLC